MGYDKNGYLLLKKFYDPSDLKELYSILITFHEAWKKDNSDFYSKRAINSAYLTSPKYLSPNDREELFKFIGSSKLMGILSSLIPDKAMFMNTQLFFNPVNKEQKNYWHRDPQYVLSLDDQQKALKKSKVLHFRIPLHDEPGIELVPGTHKRWDSKEELEVRLETNGKKNNDDLSSGLKINLEAGDLLIFSANMIHRGLYGMNRFALDILFCDSDVELAQFVDLDCLPGKAELAKIENSEIFENALFLKNKFKAEPQ
ncbi:phytanoyl-CoA dioxygenase [Bacteriovorax stolpii]|uniref:Phytanoyl-CoA dioxygenase n=1 Tax=Bacteriovorax stolpii TaxID=960 RepID=A0A2K9NWT2_BACTC|nr:phytanoyl-CoA dioxygenase family protein [Bacteriovorax stolpii]AUN99525.1 phytanoyl-CoA dioxygenase [Bacteriovorax stolpii]QDK40481.1 phytanoyl-CoA dioxygenase [Bacteriovorax stolpii]TDP51154.1 ectoine hydroxylase-related dioxygenase (phytanoyl-CoA dioxygenase family) [Bacteriovorax stolpii]